MVEIQVNRNTLNALKSLGLTDYETRAYIANMSIINGTALEMSLTSNVPRFKVYEVLKSLAKKGFIEIKRGKPLKFNVISPHEVFEKSRNQINEQIDEAENELNIIYENQISKIAAPMWLVHGPEKLLKKEIEIISRAKNSIFILGGFMFDDEVNQLNESLNKAIKRGVHVKVILSPFFNDEIDMLKEKCDFDCEIKTFHVPLIKLVVRDEKEMLMAACKIKDTKIISQSAIGMWNQYSELVETMSGVYNFIWTTELFSN